MASPLSSFSIAATSFGWLLKESARGEEWKKGKIDDHSLVERYGIDASPEYEPEGPDWLIRSRHHNTHRVPAIQFLALL